MSKFNTQMICPHCEEAEQAHPSYDTARQREQNEVLRGNHNFEGIGLPPELEPNNASTTTD